MSFAERDRVLPTSAGSSRRSETSRRADDQGDTVRNFGTCDGERSTRQPIVRNSVS